MLRLVHEDAYLDPAVGPYRFPLEQTTDVEPFSHLELTKQLVGDFGPNPRDVLDAVEVMSRRMEDLARELGCESKVDDDDSDDGPPRAA